MCETKTCSKCGEVKGLGEFYAHPGCKDGHRADCKTCVKRKTRQYEIDNKEKLRAYKREYARDWRARNPDKEREKKKRARSKHAESIKGYAAEYRARKKSELSASKKQWAEKNQQRIKDYTASYSDSLCDGYIACALKLPKDACPPELLALKREQLAIKRMARELKKAATKPTGENE